MKKNIYNVYCKQHLSIFICRNTRFYWSTIQHQFSSRWNTVLLAIVDKPIFIEHTPTSLPSLFLCSLKCNVHHMCVLSTKLKYSNMNRKCPCKFVLSCFVCYNHSRCAVTKPQYEKFRYPFALRKQKTKLYQKAVNIFTFFTKNPFFRTSSPTSAIDPVTTCLTYLRNQTCQFIKINVQVRVYEKGYTTVMHWQFTEKMVLLICWEVSLSIRFNIEHWVTVISFARHIRISVKQGKSVQ